MVLGVTQYDSPNKNGNPFATSAETMQEVVVQKGKPSITRRTTILGGVAGAGYTIVLMIYALRLQLWGSADKSIDTPGPGWLEIVLQTLIVGVVSSVVLAIVGAAVGTFIEIVLSIARGSDVTEKRP
jgi:hypothetical protein